MKGNLDYERNVYENVYERAKAYMMDEKVEIPFSKTVFLKSLGFIANEVDMKDWNMLGEVDFIFISYLQLLGRFPLESDVNYWISISDFRRRLIDTIINSFEFQLRGITIKNNPYPQNKRKNLIRNRLFGETKEELRSKWYFKIFTRLPNGMKKILRNIVGLN